MLSCLEKLKYIGRLRLPNFSYIRGGEMTSLRGHWQQKCLNTVKKAKYIFCWLLVSMLSLNLFYITVSGEKASLEGSFSTPDLQIYICINKIVNITFKRENDLKDNISTWHWLNTFTPILSTWKFCPCIIHCCSHRSWIQLKLSHEQSYNSVECDKIIFKRF
jgi:hypothetical protein